MSNKISAVNLDTCYQVSPSEPFIFVIRRDETVVESLIKCAEIVKFSSAFITGIGAVTNPTIAYYHVNIQKYAHKKFRGFFELTNLTGNITQQDGKYLVHAHVTLSKPRYNTIGGHLLNATSGMVVEVSVQPLPHIVFRKLNPQIKLAPIIFS